MAKDDNLISGLLRKRHELATEAIALRDKLAQVGTAIDSIDHLLSTWGQKPDTGLNPRSGLVIAFRRHELRRMVLDCLREAKGEPITSTEIAAKIIAATGRHPTDRPMRYELTKKVSKTLKALGTQGIAISETKGDRLEWCLA